MNATQRRGFEIGSIVKVLPAKVGADGWEGLYTVVNRSGDDYALARGTKVPAEEIARGWYDVWVHAQRLCVPRKAGA